MTRSGWNRASVQCLAFAARRLLAEPVALIFAAREPGGDHELAGRIEDSFARRLDALPDQTRRLLLLAAADPSGDRPLVWRAAGRLGLPAQAAAPAVEVGLVEFGIRVRFRHPLVRSAAYRSASFSDRQLAAAPRCRDHAGRSRA